MGSITFALVGTVYFQESPEPPEPVTLTKDFNASVASGGCGCSDPSDAVNCAAAVVVWRDFLNSNPGAKLTLAAGTTYNMSLQSLIVSDPGEHAGIYPDTYTLGSCTISAEPGTVMENWSVIGCYAGQSTQVRDGGFIASAFPGQTNVTLLDIADAAHFTVGQWVLVAGIALQSLGFPTNFQRYEFHQVTGISGTTITLDSPLEDTYLETWPNNVDDPTSGGAACLITMGPGWDISNTIENIRFLHADAGGGIIGFVFNPLRTLILNNLIFDETSPGVSYCETFIATGCGMGVYAAEIDKCAITAIYDHCIAPRFNIQSASPKNLIVRNDSHIGTPAVGDGFNTGFAKNTTIEDSLIEGVMHTGVGMGRCETLTITNSTTPELFLAGHGVTPEMLACMTYQGDGRWLFSSNDYVRAMNFEQSVVPGFQYCLSYLDSIWPDVPPGFSNGTPIYFCVTDISVAPGSGYNYYIQTDMPYAEGALPIDKFNTHDWQNWQAIPFTSVTIDGVVQTNQFAATVDCSG